LTTPEISVVIPVYNCERFLAQAIESALAQTYPVKEVNVVDDGSADRSLAIAQSFGPRVKVYSQSQQGPSAARNLGAAHASGDWTAFLDADDYWMPDKLEKQIRALTDFPNALLVYSGRMEVYEDGTAVAFEAQPPDWVVRRLPYANLIYPSTVIIKTSLLKQTPWNTSFRSSEDWGYFYRFSRTHVIACVAEPTTYYRVHNLSLSNRDFRVILKEAEVVAAAIQRDFHGTHKLILKARVNARLQANAAIAARRQGSDEFFSYICRSLLSWPFPDVKSNRYKLFVAMLLQRVRCLTPAARANLRRRF
jgi:glycosyltransferase involved in cell wall biosynthesis